MSDLPELTVADMLELTFSGANGSEYVDVPNLVDKAVKDLRDSAARIKALEAGLKPFAELKPVAWSLDADMFYIATNDIRHAASLLEKKP